MNALEGTSGSRIDSPKEGAKETSFRLFQGECRRAADSVTRVTKEGIGRHRPGDTERGGPNFSADYSQMNSVGIRTSGLRDFATGQVWAARSSLA